MEELSNFSLNLDVSLFSFTKWTVEEREREKKNVINENASSFVRIVQDQRFEGTKLYYYFVRGNEMNRGREREKKMLLMKMLRPSCKIKDSKEQSFIIISFVETKRNERKGMERKRLE